MPAFREACAFWPSGARHAGEPLVFGRQFRRTFSREAQSCVTVGQAAFQDGLLSDSRAATLCHALRRSALGGAMKRREFIVLAGSAAIWSFAAQSQQGKAPVRIGF